MILFLDACALIYQLEGAHEFQHAATELILRLSDQQSVELAVSRLAEMDCKVKPLREGNLDLLARYDEFFASALVVELTSQVIATATTLRAHHRLKTMDALQAASALALAQKALFITGDRVFEKVPGLDVRLIEV